MNVAVSLSPPPRLLGSQRTRDPGPRHALRLVGDPLPDGAARSDDAGGERDHDAAGGVAAHPGGRQVEGADSLRRIGGGGGMGDRRARRLRGDGDRRAGAAGTAAAALPAGGDARSPARMRGSSGGARGRPSSPACCRSRGRSSPCRRARPACPSCPFALATFAGAFIWSTFLAALGYAAGSQWDRVHGRLGQWYLPVTIAVIVVSVLAYVVIARLRARREAEGV